MTVIPLNAMSRVATGKISSFLDKHGVGLGQMLYLSGGDHGLASLEDALIETAKQPTDMACLREVVDQMLAFLEEACHPGHKLNSQLLWYGARLTELRYEL